MVKIIGVDFSGAQTDKNTWITEGELAGGSLKITDCRDCRSIKRKELTELLKCESNDTVAAMDFPFSVPLAFAKELAEKEGKGPVSRMPDLWGIVAEMDYSRFEKLRNSFVKRHGEMMRRGDVNFGGPFSPLHSVRPAMLQMTFHGMRMLHELWNAGCSVPPLPECARKEPTLLETMPGVLLRSFGLPAENYKNKNKTNGGCPQKIRRQILDGLKDKSCVSGIALSIPNDIDKKCINNHDGLDSLVAAVGAAMWVRYKSRFLIPRKSIPQSEELQAARLEGWIYAPRPIGQQPTTTNP